MVFHLVVNTLIAELLLCSSAGLRYAVFSIITHYADSLRLIPPSGVRVCLMTACEWCLSSNDVYRRPSHVRHLSGQCVNSLSYLAGCCYNSSSYSDTLVLAVQFLVWTVNWYELMLTLSISNFLPFSETQCQPFVYSNIFYRSLSLPHPLSTSVIQWQLHAAQLLSYSNDSIYLIYSLFLIPAWIYTIQCWSHVS